MKQFLRQSENHGIRDRPLSRSRHKSGEDRLECIKDGSASLYLPLSNSLFYVDRPVPRGPVCEALNIYKGITTRVLHVLLSEPGYLRHVNDLASKAGVSPSTVHQVLRVLENQLWVESQEKGPACVRVLKKPGALLDAWREENLLKQYEVHSFYDWTQSQEVLRTRVFCALQGAGCEYELSLSSGFALVASFFTSVAHVSVLVPAGPALESIWRAVGLEPVEERANVLVHMTKRDAPRLISRQVEGLWVASDIQFYLDL